MRYKCPICNQEIESRFPSWKNPHNMNYHADYARWHVNWLKIVVVATVLDILLEFLVIRQLPIQDFWLLFSAAIILIITGGALLFARLYELQGIKRRWRERLQPKIN